MNNFAFKQFQLLKQQFAGAIIKVKTASSTLKSLCPLSPRLSVKSLQQQELRSGVEFVC